MKRICLLGLPATVLGVPSAACAAEAHEEADLAKQLSNPIASPSVSFVARAEDPAIDGQGGEAEGLSSGIANLTGHPALSPPAAPARACGSASS